VPGFVRAALREGGEPLGHAVRARFEGRLGRDLSDVRIHSGRRAAESARAVNALAYTVGQDIAFASGHYAPETPPGEELLAHELKHTIKQSRSDGALMLQTGNPPGTKLSIVAHADPLPPTECSAVGVDTFDKQPAALQAVLQNSFKDAAAWFNGLRAKRPILTAIYNRLCRFGLWDTVVSVLKVESGEAPFGPFEASGSTGSAYFTTDKASNLMAALLNTGQFCADSPLGGSQHKDQASFREVSTSDSLHVAVGPNPRFDAHIDRYSPVKGGGGGECVYDPTAAAKHIGREVIPPKVRSKIGVPGVEVFPEPAERPGMFDLPKERETSPSLVGVTWRF
jgi:hypothetical protein